MTPRGVSQTTYTEAFMGVVRALGLFRDRIRMTQASLHRQRVNLIIEGITQVNRLLRRF